MGFTGLLNRLQQLYIKPVGPSTDDQFRIYNTAGARLFDVASGGRISRMVVNTVALASMASNGSQTVTLTGIGTADALMWAYRDGATGTGGTGLRVWSSAADVLAATPAAAASVAAATVTVWFFITGTAAGDNL